MMRTTSLDGRLRDVGAVTRPDTRDELVYDLWDRLVDEPHERVDDALGYMLGRLCEIFDAQDACWSGSVRIAFAGSDPLGGWRPCAIHPLRPGGPLARAFAAGMERLRRSPRCVDLTTIQHARQAGRFRTNRLCDLAPPEWFASPFYQTVYLAHGLADAVYVSVPVGQCSESYVVLTRDDTRARFSVAERDAVGRALRGLKWFHRRIFLSRGLMIASEPLTRAERKVLEHLLTGQSDKEIAASLGRSFHTAREHVTAIYRKFGVSGRAALMALWMSRDPGRE